jgi:dTDP-4-amino-4,6-dideoxygalactose transaminase
MKKMNYIAPRSDYFYYLEVWDKIVLRDSKISDILGEESSKPRYVNGSQKQLNMVDKIEFSLFWKNKESAYHRITTLKRHRTNDNYEYLVKSMNREEFLSIIPDEIPIGNKYNQTCWLKNKELKDKEKTYKRKIENPWRNFKIKDISDVFIS